MHTTENKTHSYEALSGEIKTTKIKKSEVKKAEKAYPLLAKELEELKANNETISSLIIWHDPEAEFGGDIFGYQVDADGDVDSLHPLFESLYIGVHDYSIVKIMEYVLMNLHKDGKFEGIVSSFPFEVSLEIEDTGSYPIFTIYNENGLTANAEDVRKQFEIK